MQSRQWPDRACRDLDTAIFYPSDGVGVDRAIAICERCPRRQDCLEVALADREDDGVWGGTSERERRRILRRRRKERTAA